MELSAWVVVVWMCVCACMGKGWAGVGRNSERERAFCFVHSTRSACCRFFFVSDISSIHVSESVFVYAASIQFRRIFFPCLFVRPHYCATYACHGFVYDAFVCWLDATCERGIWSSLFVFIIINLRTKSECFRFLWLFSNMLGCFGL